MSYHRFSNLRELLQADLMRKTSHDIVSRDEMSRECQCTKALRISAGGTKCIFGSECRKKCVVYKATCLLCNKFYIGKTSQFVKDRFQAHCNLVQVHANQKPSGLQKDLPPTSTLVSHLVHHLNTVHEPTSTIRASHVRRLLRVGVVWKGNPIGCSKTFGTVKCRLCMKERILLFKNRLKSSDLLLNNNLGIHQGCNCVRKMRFHRLQRKYIPCPDSTDEGHVPERSE